MREKNYPLIGQHFADSAPDKKNLTEMQLMMRGYGLTTAEILYRMPDHQRILQTYIWQDYDLAPKFPALQKFVDFWQSTLDGPLHSIAFTHRRLIAANEWRKVDGEFRFN